MINRIRTIFRTKQGRLFLILILEGIILRFLAATQGMTVDFESYRIVAELVREGGALYEDTTRYNYAPMWAFLLAGFDLVSDILNNPELFRVWIVSTLTIADIAVTAVLIKRYGLKTAMFYWFNPLTILGAGYFMQFDAIAVALILIALTEKEGTNPTGILMGLSLVIKHVFVLFPVWLLLRKQGLRMHGRSVLIAYSLLLSSFIPFVGQWRSILEVVVGYSANNAGILDDVFAPQVLSWYLPQTVIFVLILLGCGWLLRRLEPFTAALWYTVVLVMFSPVMLHTYLIIPAAAIAVFANPVFAAYVAVSSYLFTLDGMGMSIAALVESAPSWLLSSQVHDRVYLLPLLVLGGGIIWHVRKTLLGVGSRWLRHSIDLIRQQWSQFNDYSATR